MKRFETLKSCLVFMFILSVFLVTGCGGGSSSSAGGDNGGSPTVNPVSFTVPPDGTGDVAINRKLTATFSEEMDPATINNTTFTLAQGGTAVSGTVDYSGVTAVFTPDVDLEYSTSYTATITTGAKNPAGNALESDYVWTFTTGAAAADTTAPTVTLTDPADTETDVPVNRQIAATFSEAMDPLTITEATFTVTGPGAASVTGTVAYAGVIATFTPDSDLAVNTDYTATITTGAEDLAFQSLASDYVWTFTTGVDTDADTTAPTVTLTVPADLDTDVILNKKVQATFSEAMDPLTISTATFTLAQGATPVSGTVTYVGLVASFTPAADLTANTTYTATITTGAQDLAFNPLASDSEWSFTTVAALPSGPLPVDLGTAGNFVILTKTGITTTGATDITGDIGVSPIDHTAMTGFSLILDPSNEFSTSALVTGNVYAADYAVPTPANMTTAISDMETAYTDAAGRTTPDGTELYAGNLSGQNFPPGLYKWGSDVSVNAASTVTLTGGADDVWIFQIAGNLTMNPGSSVTLAGTAQAKNVFWQVAGGVGVSFDTTVAFQGNVLAQAGITLNSLATLNGRALAQTNVTLIANTVTAP